MAVSGRKNVFHYPICKHSITDLSGLALRSRRGHREGWLNYDLIVTVRFDDRNACDAIHPPHAVELGKILSKASDEQERTTIEVLSSADRNGNSLVGAK
jgi:hypothetical protein